MVDEIQIEMTSLTKSKSELNFLKMVRYRGKKVPFTEKTTYTGEHNSKYSGFLN